MASTTGKSYEERSKQKDAVALAAVADVNSLKEKKVDRVLYPANGALTKVSGAKVLNKTSIGAYTLAAPTAGEEGNQIMITSTTAFAHVVTATSALENGTGTKTTATFAAFAGANLTLVAIALKWHVKSVMGVVIT